MNEPSNFFLLYKRSAQFDILKEFSCYLAKELDKEILSFLKDDVLKENEFEQCTSNRNILGEL